MLDVAKWLDAMQSAPHHAAVPPRAVGLVAAMRAQRLVQATWEGVQVCQTAHIVLHTHTMKMGTPTRAQHAMVGHADSGALADAHQRAMDTLHRLARETYTEWVATMDASVLRGLSQPLLVVVRGEKQHGLLDVNMDPALSTALTEVPWFHQAGLTLPAAAAELLARRSRLVTLQAKAAALCRMHNEVPTRVMYTSPPRNANQPAGGGGSAG